ncbi:MAG: type II toxin-antitoxin system ParD family antitoxin [Acidobacteriota bacterium]
MDVTLTPDQEAFIRHAIESGRFKRKEDVVQEALALWEERERERAGFFATLQDARSGAGRGQAITEESVRYIAEDVKRRGAARFAAEQP